MRGDLLYNMESQLNPPEYLPDGSEILMPPLTWGYAIWDGRRLNWSYKREIVVRTTAGMIKHVEVE